MTRWAWCAAVLLACTPKEEEPADTGDTDTGEAPEDTGDPLPQDADQDGSPAEEDCDDADPTVFPGAPDLCGDDKVTNCNRSSDDGLVTLDGAQGFDDLQQALNAAAPGAELLLCAGTHTGPFHADVAVTLRAHGDPGVVVLSGDQAGPALSLPGDSELYGLVLKDGNAESGGALQMSGPGDLYLEDCLLTESRAQHGGGLALATGSTATLVRTTLQSNLAFVGGGGAYVPAGATLDLSDGSVVRDNRSPESGAGVYLTDGSLVGGIVSDNVIEDPPTVPSYWSSGGGGVWATGTCSVTGTEISGNSGPQGGGALIWAGSMVMEDVSLHNNSAPYGSGGGLVIWDSGAVLLGASEIYDNFAYTGGGALVSNGSLEGGHVHGNEADTDGGGLYLQRATLQGALVELNSAVQGGGLFVTSPSELLELVVRENDAETGGGVAIISEIVEIQPTHIEGGEISENFGSNGGGLYAEQPLEIVGTALTDNVGVFGGALRAADRDIRLEGLSVLRNFADLGGGIYVGDAALTLELVDFGTGADDNSTSDVLAGDTEYDSFGADTTTQCNANGCLN